MASDPRLHADLLSQVELFRGLDRLSLAKLSASLEPVAVQARAILFRQGDRPDGLYLVTRGTFSIYAETDGSDGSKLFTHAQARPVALAYALLVLVGLVASVPVWRVMGLL